jgi:hypothetical protein
MRPVGYRLTGRRRLGVAHTLATPEQQAAAEYAKHCEDEEQVGGK